MTSKSLFLLSNGSGDLYPNNTLTNFTNRLPAVLEIPENEKGEIAVESVGFSCLFRNIKIPDDDTYPSFMITNCVTTNDFTNYDICNSLDIQDFCHNFLDFKFEDNEDGKNCFWYFGRFSDKYYTEEDLSTYFNAINREYRTDIKFIDGALQFGRDEFQKWYWVLVHPTMMETFEFEANTYLNYKYDTKLDYVSDGKITAQKLLGKLVNYKGHMYFAYRIGMFDEFLTANNRDIAQRSFPKVVKIVAESIQPQIFNNSFSHDLVVFCPDFNKKEEYYFQEFETKQYVPLLNSSISEFQIKLCDEDNNQLQLLPGVSTIVKLNISKMSKNKRSFNVRLTSIKNKDFRDNTNYNFRVKLPNVLSLDKDWRVALTAISHPNVFKTFLPHKNNRGLLVRQVEGNTIMKQAPKIYSDDVYTMESIVYELKEFFTKHNFGSVTLSPDNKLSIKFKKSGSFIVSNNVLRVFGYNEKINLQDNATEIFIDRNNNTLIVTGELGFEEYELKFGAPINIDCLKPNYIIAYTNFVESSIIGGVYSKILRVIPLTSKEKGFVLTDFKHNEYLELQNTEISEIEIMLRAHDGEYVNFATQEDVIINLEFTNAS